MQAVNGIDKTRLAGNEKDTDSKRPTRGASLKRRLLDKWPMDWGAIVPRELWVHIFRLLDSCSMGTIGRVCKTWVWAFAYLYPQGSLEAFKKLIHDEALVKLLKEMAVWDEKGFLPQMLCREKAVLSGNAVLRSISPYPIPECSFKVYVRYVSDDHSRALYQELDQKLCSDANQAILFHTCTLQSSHNPVFVQVIEMHFQLVGAVKVSLKVFFYDSTEYSDYASFSKHWNDISLQESTYDGKKLATRHLLKTLRGEAHIRSAAAFLMLVGEDEGMTFRAAQEYKQLGYKLGSRYGSLDSLIHA